MPLSARGVVRVLACSMLLAPAALHAQFGTNLVVNGNAEAGPGVPNDFTISFPPGWVVSGAFTAVQYGASGGFPTAASPGSPTRGSNFFAGGPGNAGSSALQHIDFNSSMWASIDAGTATYTLSGWLGGFETQNDYATLMLRLFDASDVQIGGSVALVGPNAADRLGVTGMLFMEFANMSLATGARSADVELDMTRTDGAYNDGYADDVSFVVTGGSVSATPEPASVVLLATGLIGIVGFARRRKA